jgi:hypothetical protein
LGVDTHIIEHFGQAGVPKDQDCLNERWGCGSDEIENTSGEVRAVQALHQRGGPELVAGEDDLEQASLRPFSHGGLCLNFPGFGEETEAMLRDAYGPNYQRLPSCLACCQ